MRWPWKTEGDEKPRRAPAEDEEFIRLALERFERSKSALESRREEYSEDARFVNVLGGQWNKSVRQHRENRGKPAHEFNELHTYVQQIVNRARQNRPQPRVDPGDSPASTETAEFLGGRLRHIQYASQADIAYDTAVDCAATGGWGVLAIEAEYVDGGALGGKPTFNQEPRIRRVLDPLTEYPDPSALEPDFSDAKFWFSRWWMDREEYQRKYHKDPIPWEKDASEDWASESQVCLAKYWTVDETPRRYIALSDGTEGYEDELEVPEGVQVVNEREDLQRQVMCHIIDGEKRLESTEWMGRWIPRIIVLGSEKVVDGQVLWISAVRFARGPQKLKNAYKSAIANLLQLASTAPWTGPKGMFRDARWRDAHLENYPFLEWDPVYTKDDQLIPAKPERNTYETPIQSLSAAAMQSSDDIKRSVGYSDAILQPSKADLSGVAVQRRQEGVNLTNFHFEDNLVRAQWHCARVVLDLDMALADSPRVLRARKEDGMTWSAPVTRQMDGGHVPQVQGWEGKPHHRLDVGSYDITITTGPGYATKLEQELDFLLEALRGNPQGWTLYADRIFSLLGYKDLEERARLALPPQIQQAMNDKAGNVPPQVRAQLLTLMQQNQQMRAALQQMLMKLQTKQVEQQGRLHVERLKAVKDVMVEGMRHDHEADLAVQEDRMEMIRHLTELLQASAAGPEEPPSGAAPAAAPAMPPQ